MKDAETAIEPHHEPGEPGLLGWMKRQYHSSAKAMLGAISATHLVKARRGFGQTIRPVKGSVLASPVIASYDPDPDYFFHWLRDSAVIMDALRCLIAAGTIRPRRARPFQGFLSVQSEAQRARRARFPRQGG